VRKLRKRNKRIKSLQFRSYLLRANVWRNVTSAIIFFCKKCLSDFVPSVAKHFAKIVQSSVWPAENTLQKSSEKRLCQRRRKMRKLSSGMFKMSRTSKSEIFWRIKERLESLSKMFRGRKPKESDERNVWVIN